MALLSDQRTCNLSCSVGEFTCTERDFRCIPWYFRCNGVADCMGGEDERNCSKLDGTVCLSTPKTRLGPTPVSK